MDKCYVLDTNIILEDANQVLSIAQNGRNRIVLPETVIDELDAKKHGFAEINFQAREFGRILSEAKLLSRTTVGTASIVSLGIGETLIEIISLSEYNLKSNESSNKNDLHIIEVAKWATENYNNVVLLSNDIMCRVRATSLDVSTECLNNKKLTTDHQFVKTIYVKDVNVDGLPAKDIDPTYTQGNYCYHIKGEDGNEQLAYVVNNRFTHVDEEELRKSHVKPLNSGQLFAAAGMSDERIDICIIDALAGCCLKGTSVDIITPKMSKSQIIDTYELTKSQYKRLKSLDGCGVDGIDIGLINFVKYTNASNDTRTLKNDVNYKSKYCHLRYWLSFTEPRYALDKVRQVRKYSKFFELNDFENNFKDYNKLNFQKTIMLIQSKIINCEPNSHLADIICLTHWCESYWTDRGWSDVQAKSFVSEKQRENSMKILEKYSEKEIKKMKGYPTTIQYFLDKGMSIDEAKLALKERQTTFSLKKCIKKYGKKEGQLIWEERQRKWQATINSKPQHEIDDINRRKSSGLGRFDDREMPGKLYYIKFYSDDVAFWKIGITTKSVEKRFNLSTLLTKHGLQHEVVFENDVDTINEAYEQEQFILKFFNEYRTTIEYNGFSTTEAFECDVLKEFINA